ncbi:tryptophan halogenase family protein [Shewanella violacea]|uniref:Tryptophan halogenase, putative n=1 Tax=Shewanella violacea (strain JCM 10179 / CIP 106290 / LMG 19151 / DSS12) TaxID=637905 RepID=D4ZIJ1_SHEVD|nr:tryptophan halogenase family protein [Shewanella violacea]BAJ01490.1 tryptophan halogenase, putative [Shewanella violacea DSS12]
MMHAIKEVTIVGGGAAGWLTAAVIAAEHISHLRDSIHVTLIESPEVSSIGVGEGTWPSMRSTLEKIGISESEFMLCCDASFKQGSKFVAWKNGHHTDSYYHPFMAPQGYGQANLHHAWQEYHPDDTFAHITCVQASICDAGRAPKQLGTPQYAAVTNYGYHLDAAKFAKLLMQHCTAKLGVKHIVDHMTDIISAENGDIAQICTRKSGKISGDLFIDCTGMSSLLLGKHFNIPFIEKRHILFNDTAMALHVPYEDDNIQIASTTLSTAQTCGWIWDIGLPSRRGVGYTYSSSHTCDQQVQDDLITYIAKSIGQKRAEQLSPRKISFTPGHREKFWHRNCVAVGMASGFIEPLEASALALIELSASMISEHLPVNREQMEITAKRYNERFRYRWSRVIDFLKLHYVISERQDSQYWHDNRDQQTITASLKEQLALWKYQPPNRHDLMQNEEIFPSASYQYVLYGMGFNTHISKAKMSDKVEFARQCFGEVSQNKAKYIEGLPSNRDLIKAIKQG